MAIDKESLRKLLNNPGMFNPADAEVEEENIDDALAQKIEAPAEEDVAPEEMLDQVEELPETDQSPEIKQPNIEESDMTAMLRKMKAGEPMDESSDQDNQEVAQDTQAPMEMRKLALQKIKQKYLGQ